LIQPSIESKKFARIKLNEVNLSSLLLTFSIKYFKKH
jgi:hypothetical protein